MKNKLFLIVYFSMVPVLCLAIITGCGSNKQAILTKETDTLFLYILDNETISDYLDFYYYLEAWDQNEIDIDNKSLSLLFENYSEKDTLKSLLFESFLRYSKNLNVRTKVLEYFNENNINTNFANSLSKLYASDLIIRKSGNGNNMERYSFNNTEFDENINLFSVIGITLFDDEIGMLLFQNDWGEYSFDNSNNENIKDFLLGYGGETNAVTITFRRYSSITEKEIDSIYSASSYIQKYHENWIVIPLLSKIKIKINRFGADKIAIAYGLGPDINDKRVETGTFNIYLYNSIEKVMYEISYFMNIAPINIHFKERNRIFNFLFFQIMFVNMK